MNEKMTMNDGTEIRGHLAETETRLFLYLYGISMREAFDLLTDPQKTKYIQWNRYGVTGETFGYTHLMSISEEPGGMIGASMKKD